MQRPVVSTLSLCSITAENETAPIMQRTLFRGTLLSMLSLREHRAGAGAGRWVVVL